MNREQALSAICVAYPGIENLREHLTLTDLLIYLTVSGHMLVLAERTVAGPWRLTESKMRYKVFCRNLVTEFSQKIRHRFPRGTQTDLRSRPQLDHIPTETMHMLQLFNLPCGKVILEWFGHRYTLFSQKARLRLLVVYFDGQPYQDTEMFTMHTALNVFAHKIGVGDSLC